MAMARERFVEVYSQGVTNVRKVIVDTQTGVNYLLASSNMTSGCGVAVLVDADGKPLVTPMNEEDEVVLGQLLNHE
ncbi:xylan 1,4-beta-xylosidase [Collinsella sp. An2]|nr:xylan 1,4-beta-xylosidase [Collinsella sp. An2]